MASDLIPSSAIWDHKNCHPILVKIKLPGGKQNKCLSS
jgi:hypothetical protein